MTRSCHRQHCKGRSAPYRASTVGPDAARRMVESAWHWLDDAQRAILRGRYWHGRSADQLAADMGSTAAEVSRAEAAALLLCRRVIDGLFHPGTGEPRSMQLAP